MKLSQYTEENETKWTDESRKNAKIIIDYINTQIDEDLYQKAHTKDPMEVYNTLHVWLFNFYNKAFLEGLYQANIDSNDYEKDIVLSYIITYAKQKPNEGIIYEVLKRNNVIQRLLVNDEEKLYALDTINNGFIEFRKATDYFKEDRETIDFIKRLGDKAKNGCHQISEYLLKKYPQYKAVTAICKKGLNEKYYHSFIIDEKDNVIDFTSNIVLSKNDYYKLFEVEELNVINYEEYLETAEESKEFDESKTLYPLLRMATYKQYQANTKARKIS